MRSGGWPDVMAEQHEKAVRAQRALCDALGLEAPAPAEMLGALATVPLPASAGPAPTSAWDTDPLWQRLESVHRIQIPIFAWPAPPARLLRIACPLYVGEDDVAKLCAALREELALA